MQDGLTTGVPPFDDVLDGVRVGDNLVVGVHSGTGAELFAERFIAERGDRPLVVCTSHPRRRRSSADVTIVDWSRSSDIDGVKQAVADADLSVGGDALFLFDDLSAIQDAWGPDAALDLFLWACPRLYRRESVAMWLIDPDRHRPAFMRRLTAITQVVVDVAAEEGVFELTVAKADGRPESTVGRQTRFVGQTLEPLGFAGSHRGQLGSLIRSERTLRNIAQAELARRVGITPSALSQLERGTRGVSADTITRIWEVLGVPFGPDAERSPGYRISRRASQPPPEASGGLSRQQLASDPSTGELWRVTAAPNSTGRGAPFPVKTPEMITVLRGVVDLEFGGDIQTLHEGDTVTTTTAAITGWANPGPVSAVLLWAILSR